LISKFILNKFIFEPNKIRFPIVRNRLEKMLHDKI
ncbi:MAG: DNA repair protein RecO, partial [Proteobacteria bacterium]|nr:DNA repair protein RecO [Pseudomonadota bacterium]